MVFSALFGIVGFLAGLLLMIINLCTIKTFGKPYLLPISPFLPQDQGNALIRKKASNNKTRPTYLTKKNVVREASK